MALGPDQIASYASNFFDTQILRTLGIWIGYLAIAAIIIGAMVALYFAVQYKYKIRIALLHYSPDGKSAQIIGWKRDRARLVRKKGSAEYVHILMVNAKVHKFSDEEVLPGNVVYLLKVDKADGSYIPVPTVNFEGGISTFATIKPEAKYWAILQLRENERTYADVDAQKRILTYTMVAIVIMIAGVSFVAWIMMKQAGGVVAGLEGLAPDLQNMAEAFRGSAPG